MPLFTGCIGRMIKQPRTYTAKFVVRVLEKAYSDLPKADMKKSQTWKAIRREILRSWRPWMKVRFPYDTPPLPSDQLRDFVSEAHREHHSEVDRAILEFAASGCWPSYANDYAYFLAIRLEFANYILIDLISGPVPPPQAPREAILRWLLIDCWMIHGCRSAVNSFEGDEALRLQAATLRR
jgi:hypothetical protein